MFFCKKRNKKAKSNYDEISIVKGATVPPVTVNVANSYSATVKPALLCAVIRTLYQVAGSRSSTTKLPPGLTLFEI